MDTACSSKYIGFDTADVARTSSSAGAGSIVAVSTLILRVFAVLNTLNAPSTLGMEYTGSICVTRGDRARSHHFRYLLLERNTKRKRIVHEDTYA